MQQSGDARKGRVLWLVGYRFTNLHFLFSMASVVCAKKKNLPRARWLSRTNPAQRKPQTQTSMFCAVSRHILFADLAQPRMTARSLHGQILRIPTI